MNKNAKDFVNVKIGKKLGSIALIIIGAIFIVPAVLFGVLFLIGLCMIMPGPEIFLYSGLVMGAIGAPVFFVGSNTMKRIKRLNEYVRIMGKNLHCTVADFAQFTKQSEKFVVKDLSKMMNLGMFQQAYFDDDKTYFMLSDNLYSEYVKLRDSKNLRKEVEKTIDKNDTLEIAKRQIKELVDAKTYLQREVISIKLDKLISICRQIVSYVEEKPEKLVEVNKFVNHYLPMTLKLVKTYKNIVNQSIVNENAESSKREIEASLDTINEAFQNLFEDLFDEVALDVATDISVLKTLFEQDGLTEDKF